MQRIKPASAGDMSETTIALLAAVTKQMGGVPNVIAALTRSPATLEAWLGLTGGLAKGRFPPALREQIALTVAGANDCDYCASAHTALARRAGLETMETARDLTGRSADPRTAAMLRLAGLIVLQRGRLDDADIAAFHAAGHDDEDLVELTGHVAVNMFTNYFNHIAGTEIDFPHVSAAAA